MKLHHIFNVFHRSSAPAQHVQTTTPTPSFVIAQPNAMYPSSQPPHVATSAALVQPRNLARPNAAQLVMPLLEGEKDRLTASLVAQFQQQLGQANGEAEAMGRGMVNSLADAGLFTALANILTSIHPYETLEALVRHRQSPLGQLQQRFESLCDLDPWQTAPDSGIDASRLNQAYVLVQHLMPSSAKEPAKQVRQARLVAANISDAELMALMAYVNSDLGQAQLAGAAQIQPWCEAFLADPVVQSMMLEGANAAIAEQATRRPAPQPVVMGPFPAGNPSPQG